MPNEPLVECWPVDKCQPTLNIIKEKFDPTTFSTRHRTIEGELHFSRRFRGNPPAITIIALPYIKAYIGDFHFDW
jgi:hypothetical protein